MESDNKDVSQTGMSLGMPRSTNFGTLPIRPDSSDRRSRRVSLSRLDFTDTSIIKPSFIEFYRVLPSFAGFDWV